MDRGDDWGIDLDALAAARDALAERVSREPHSYPVEQLANAHAWLGEAAEARERFTQAAAASVAELREYGGDADPYRLARVASLHLRAGRANEAAPWFERALAVETDLARAAPYRYLLGDVEGALAAAVRAPEPDGILHAVESLARARRDRDPTVAAALAGTLARWLQEDRSTPEMDSGAPDLPTWDWLAEAFRVEAELAGEPVPDRPEMLRRAGLLRPGSGIPAPATTPDVSPSREGSYALTVAAPGGGEVTATVTVDDWLDVALVPHPDRPDLRVELEKQGGQWNVRAGGEPVAGTYWGYREALAAAAPALRERSDGDWAITVIDALATASYGE